MNSFLKRTLILPHLEVSRFFHAQRTLYAECHTVRRPMACPVCASLCSQIYDKRLVSLRDEKIRQFQVVLKVWKKRYFCPQCKKPKTEPIDGVLPKRRYTQRFRKQIYRFCEQFSSLEQVRQEMKCSKDLIYRSYYEALDLEERKRFRAFPDAIGLDEHSYRRLKHHGSYGATEYAVMVVDHRKKRAIEVVEGKSCAALESSLTHVSHRDRVKWVTLDLCDPFKKFARSYFPQAELIADKFHVLRLLNGPLNQARKAVTGDRRSLRIRTDLLRSRFKLDYKRKREIDRFLEPFDELREIYQWKERLHGFYRIRGAGRARRAMIKMLDEMALSEVNAIRRLRKTLKKWFQEILNYFKTRLTNARVEGFNNVAKTVKKRAYGFRSFKNYRLRVLNACF